MPILSNMKTARFGIANNSCVKQLKKTEARPNRLPPFVFQTNNHARPAKNFWQYCHFFFAGRAIVMRKTAEGEV